MISQALIIREGQLLMVKQYVFGGRIVWNFPGGGIEEDETPEQACIREVKEETGFETVIKSLLSIEDHHKYTYVADIIGGEIGFDNNDASNDDLLEVAWISLDDHEKFDRVTEPLVRMFLEHEKCLQTNSF